jgi:hypothetical protein
MQDWILTVVVIAALLVLIAIDMSFKSRKAKKSQLCDIKSSWGKKPQNEYDKRDMERFSLLFKSSGQSDNEYAIDDITWNDLEMDKLYQAMNSTLTTPGDEMLYDMLRKPLLDKLVFEKRKALIQYWEDHPEEREQVQMTFARMEKFPGRSPTVFLTDSRDLDLNDGFRFKIYSFIPLIAALLLFVNINLGLVLLILSLGFNAFYHNRVSKEIDSRLTALSATTLVISLAGSLLKLDLPGLEAQQERLTSLYQQLAPMLKKGSPLLFGDNSFINPSDFTYILRSYFLLDIWGYHSAVGFARKMENELEEMIRIVGEWDASICIASYRKSLNNCCIPSIRWDEGADNGVFIQAQGVTHPLIDSCVGNPVVLTKPLLLTGSNASGKSTYLKVIALNTLLAHTIITCNASSWSSVPLFPMTSMALRDNMDNGVSYFMAEILSLKRMFDKAGGRVRCLCVVDEVLRGTNTIERIAASSTLLMALSRLNTCLVAATHDVELTVILEVHFESRHFDESVTESDVLFDYRLKEGRTTSRNAIKLLSLMGFKSELIDYANHAVESFEQNRQWKAINA